VNGHERASGQIEHATSRCVRQRLPVDPRFERLTCESQQSRPFGTAERLVAHYQIAAAM
jgi:hypothetical protein